MPRRNNKNEATGKAGENIVPADTETAEDLKEAIDRLGDNSAAVAVPGDLLTAEDQPRPGWSVRYVLDRGPNKGEARPAVVVSTKQDAVMNLTVFIDREQDGVHADTEFHANVAHDPSGKEAGSWHWPGEGKVEAEPDQDA